MVRFTANPIQRNPSKSRRYSRKSWNSLGFEFWQWAPKKNYVSIANKLVCKNKRIKKQWKKIMQQIVFVAVVLWIFPIIYVQSKEKYRHTLSWSQFNESHSYDYRKKKINSFLLCGFFSSWQNTDCYRFAILQSFSFTCSSAIDFATWFRFRFIFLRSDSTNEQSSGRVYGGQCRL